MEVVAPLARSPDFQFNTATFSPYTTAPSSSIPIADPFSYQYHYTSAPASPARAAAIYSGQFTAWAYPTPNSRLRNHNGGDLYDDFTFSPTTYHRPICRPFPEVTTADKVFEEDRRKSRSLTPIKRGRISLAPNYLRDGRRKSRSLSPLRNEEFLGKNTSPPANPVKCGLSRRWPRLKDLLLFRSASEGRASGSRSKDRLQNHTILPSAPPVDKKRGGEDKKTGGSGGGETVRRGSRPAVSAHEKLYTANRAAAEEQKRKTALPFQRHGLLSFIDLSPAGRGKNKVVGASPLSRKGESERKNLDPDVKSK